MNGDVRESYARCRQVARRAGSNFYLSFFLLPSAQRGAMCALYAFLRHTDDLADSDAPLAERREQLHAWRTALDEALAGRFRSPLLPALADTVRRYDIPPQYLYDAIDGAEMDLDTTRYATFADLKGYCHRAASVVGLACLRIWGCSTAEAEQPARRCGVAFQLTNILRDLKEDAARGRIYLPLEDLARFGCPEAELLQARFSANVGRLVQFEVERAHAFYDEAAALQPLLPRDGRRAWRVMMATYREMLRDIEARGGNVFETPIRLGRWRRFRLVAQALLSPDSLVRQPSKSPSPPAASSTHRKTA